MSRERLDRLEKLSRDMDVIIKDIGPKMIHLGHLRQEAKLIIEELQANVADK